MLVMLGAFFVSGTLGVWVTENQPPTRIIEVAALTPRVAAGDYLELRYDVLRLDRCYTNIDRVVVDARGVRFVLPDIDFAAVPGPLGHDTFVITARVPEKAAPGMARYMAVASYACNPFHRLWPVTQVLSDVAFQVVE